ANHPHVVSLQSLLGDFQYKIIFLCRGLHEVQTFLSEVFSGAGDVFTEKLVAPRLGIALYQKKYLDPTYKNYTSFDFAPNGELFVPDDFDQRLLYQLGAFPFESMRKLAQTLSAPYSTIERRIKKLRELKVIEGFYWDIDLCALGMQAYRLLVMKKGICLNTKEKLAQFCAQHPHITFLVDAIGAWDFEIGVEASGTRTVNQIVEELYGICGMRIAWIKVLMEDKNYKCSFYEINPVKQLERVAAA
ncbi:MAG: Lrp/AsnC family transcriptional regulator, partial [Bdellovibrionales bacterium]|nr:Lrp/AsnC family transcriptional regulator [Bdellovibrionales bacterium]